MRMLHDYESAYPAFNRRIATFVVLYICYCVPFTTSAAVLEELEAGRFIPVETSRQVAAPARSDKESRESGDATDALASGASLTDTVLVAGRTAVIFDAVREHAGPARLKRVKGLPKPRAIASDLSPKQMRMRRLTVAVAHRFAGARGVRRAKLDRQQFVALFTTMIHRESNFDHRAVSRAGARGLGQLMPETARSLGICNAFAPGENLKGAATYLTMMLEQFGTVSMALAAYNAGPAAVSQYRGIPPYSETRQYVADIIHEANRASWIAPSQSRGLLAFQSDDGERASAPGPFSALLNADAGASRCTMRQRADAAVDGQTSPFSKPSN